MALRLGRLGVPGALAVVEIDAELGLELAHDPHNLAQGDAALLAAQAIAAARATHALQDTGAHELLDDFLDRIDDYDRTRDFPAVKGPSYLSTHLRFGTVSIRQLAREAHARMTAGSAGAAVWLSELIWRDFYVQVLHNFAHVGRGESFKPDYDLIKWEHGTHAHKLFDAWCQARTGYPLVDAAMRQLVYEHDEYHQAFCYLRNPTDDIYLEAVRARPGYMGYVPNEKRTLQMYQVYVDHCRCNVDEVPEKWRDQIVVPPPNKK